MKNCTSSLRFYSWNDFQPDGCKSMTSTKRSHEWGMSSQSVEQRFHSPAVRKLSLPLSLLSRAEKKHTLLSLHFLALSLPSSLLLRPSPPWWMEGMNSPRPPWVSLWGPQQLNKQHALNLKAQSGIYLNHVRLGYFFVYGPEEGTWKIDFCRAVITQNLLTFFFFFKTLQL